MEMKNQFFFLPFKKQETVYHKLPTRDPTSFIQQLQILFIGGESLTISSNKNEKSTTNIFKCQV